MPQQYAGEVTAPFCEVRFAFSGKVTGVGKKSGDSVKQWEWVASLDRKVLQTELDLELADYEKTRADFEIFGIKNGQGGDDIVKYSRQEKQAALNAAVKRVELAKYKLDQADINSPVSGVIVDMEGLVTWVNVTPAGASVTIADTSALQFRFEVPQKDMSAFEKPVRIGISFSTMQKEYAGLSEPPLFGKAGVFIVSVTPDDMTGLLPGLVGKATVL